jgi:hypothetical protein
MFRALVVAAVASLLLVGCSDDQPSARSKPSAPPTDPQKILDGATQHVKDYATGSYDVDVQGAGVTIKGTWDLDAPFIRQALTTRPPDPDLPNGFTFKSLIYKDEVFFRVSKGPMSKCWTRQDPADIAALAGVTDVVAFKASDVIDTTPPAAQMLMDPVALGFNASTTKIDADVSLRAAFSASLTKAANLLVDKIADNDRAPVVLKVVDGQYTEASFKVTDLLSSAQIRPKDLKKAGLAGEGVTPRQAFDVLSSVEVLIRYGEFGQKVDVSRPNKDEIAEFDAATAYQDSTVTCKAAAR